MTSHWSFRAVNPFTLVITTLMAIHVVCVAATDLPSKPATFTDQPYRWSREIDEGGPGIGEN